MTEDQHRYSYHHHHHPGYSLLLCQVPHMSC